MKRLLVLIFCLALVGCSRTTDKKVEDNIQVFPHDSNKSKNTFLGNEEMDSLNILTRGLVNSYGSELDVADLYKQINEYESNKYEQYTIILRDRAINTEYLVFITNDFKVRSVEGKNLVDDTGLFLENYEKFMNLVYHFFPEIPDDDKVEIFVNLSTIINTVEGPNSTTVLDGKVGDYSYSYIVNAKIANNKVIKEEIPYKE
ncbi:hypothetical protein MGH68_14080 [Erysipelothrix sp. D19-032]